MDVETLATFVEVIRRRSFAKVARDRNVDPSTISRAVATLESELGVRLFHRTTRELAPTEAALAYFERVAPLVAELRDAYQSALDADETLRGVLRVTAAVTFAETNLVPLLPAFAAEHPALVFDLVLTNAVVDLVVERIDLAVRVGRLVDSSLVSQRLCPMVYVVCASPAYLAARGRPRRPSELSKHDCLLYPAGGDGTRWHFRLEGCDAEEVRVRGRVVANNGAALRTCGVLGMGILMLPRWNVADELQSGALVPILEDYEATLDEFGTSAWLVYPTRKYVPRKVRTFAGYLKTCFANGPPAELRTR